MVFVYGGGEGSRVAVPVTNKILRHYFNIQDEDEVADVAEEEPIPALQPDISFTRRLLGTDSWKPDEASIIGFILDEQGRGVGDITVDVMADGEVVAQLISTQSGQFDLDGVEATEAEIWQLRLPDYFGAPLLQLDIANGLRYLVEFEAQPVNEVQLKIQP